MNIDYKMLPPGRNRRLSYSANLQQRTFHAQTTFSNYFQTGQRHVIEMMNEQIQFPTNSHGLLSLQLLQKTSVQLSTEMSFCVICQADITKTDIVRQLDCKHSFHINCIDTWFIENKCCPTCKRDI